MSERCELSISELTDGFYETIRYNPNIDSIINHIYNELVEEVLIGVVFEVHRSIKTGVGSLQEGSQEDDAEFFIIDKPDVDIFGQCTVKKIPDCVCPNCDRPVAASRFAPHLQNCMGMGRNSSRIATKRNANNSREGTSYAEAVLSDDGDDVNAKRTIKKRRKKLPIRSNGTKKPSKFTTRKENTVLTMSLCPSVTYDVTPFFAMKKIRQSLERIKKYKN